VKGPAADATDALQPWGLLCNPMMMMMMIIIIIFYPFPSNGAPVEWKWQGKTEELGEKPVPVPLCPPQIPHGLTPASNPDLRGGRPAANRLGHGADISKHIRHVTTSKNSLNNSPSSPRTQQRMAPQLKVKVRGAGFCFNTLHTQDTCTRITLTRFASHTFRALNTDLLYIEVHFITYHDVTDGVEV
jgi:hypothetical protein